MKRRTTDPPAPLMPLARLTAAGLVAAVATLAAVQFGPAGSTSAPTSSPASGTGVVLTTSKSTPEVTIGEDTNLPVADAEANTLLGEVSVPPGSARLTSRPDDAPNHGRSPFQPQASTVVTRTAWWSSTLSPADTLDWIRAHPARDLEASISGPSLVGFLAFNGNSFGVFAQATVYAETFALPDGKTGVQLSSVVVYQPDRSPQQTIPATAKLVAIPEFPGSGGRGGASVTLTDRAQINRVAQIINALPAQPLGTFSCPIDTGGGLELDFESSSGAALAQVQMKTGGCGGVFVTTDAKQQPALASSDLTVQQIQDVLGTHWQLR